MYYRVIASMVGLFPGGSANADNPMGRGTVCFPPSWDGLVAGYSIDRDVVTIYGTGRFIRNIGHGGGRAYLDSTKSVEMITDIEVDNRVESIRITSTEGREADLRNTPVSERINKDAGFGMWKKLRIGSGSDSVTTNLGEPYSRKKNSQGHAVWIYRTDYSNTDC